MKSIFYPANFAPIAENELTYISGGSDSSSGLIVAGAAIVGLAVAGMAVSSLSSNSLQKEYEEKYGVSAFEPGTRMYTSDFMNYQTRAAEQGRNFGAGFASGLSKTLITPFALVAAIGLLGVTLYLANAE